MSGDPYIKENERLEAEIVRLQASKDEWIKQAAEMEAQRDKLRAAIEEIRRVEANPDDPDYKVCPRCNCWIARPLEWEPIEARVEIARLQELLRGIGANRYWEGRWRDAEAALEEIANDEACACHTAIARKALAKEGK